jgi:hypothetical protein
MTDDQPRMNVRSIYPTVNVIRKPEFDSTIFSGKDVVVVIAINESETCPRLSMRPHASIHSSVSPTGSCMSYPVKKISSCSPEVHRGI